MSSKVSTRSKPAAKARPKAAPAAVATSLRSLAKALSCSHTAVIRAKQREDWPFAKAPYDVAQAREWFAANVPPDNATDEDTKGGRPSGKALTETQRVKLAILKEELEQKRRESEEFRRNYHRIEECTREQVSKVVAVKTQFLALPDSGLVERMLNASAEEARAMLRGRLTEICEEFARGGISR